MGRGAYAVETTSQEERSGTAARVSGKGRGRVQSHKDGDGAAQGRLSFTCS